MDWKNKRNLEVRGTSLSKHQVAFATSIGFLCGSQTCRKTSKLQAETMTDLIDNHLSWAQQLPTVKYALNIRMVLALQCLGKGQASAAILGGMLSILVSDAVYNKWTALEEAVGKIQVILVNNILTENIETEKLLLKSKMMREGTFFASPLMLGGTTKGQERPTTANPAIISLLATKQA
jgi:hypothetical protein